MTGPFETEREAREASWYAKQGQFGAIDAANYAMLADACARAHIDLGAYDWRILEWLAKYEPATCAVIAGLIARAAGPGGK
jgi:hypothetical protein